MKDILIFSGQSNMQGETNELVLRDIPEGAAFEYKWLDDALVPVIDPVGEDITYERTQGKRFVEGTNQDVWLSEHIAGSCCYGNTTLIPSFCAKYNELTGHEVVAVHFAKGSTEITDWMPGTPCYEGLRDKTLAAIAKVKETDEVGHIFLAWLQGESDAIFSRKKDDYKAKITEFANKLAEDVGLEKFGIIRVGQFVNDERDDEIINAQEEVCAEEPIFLMLTRITAELLKQPEYLNPFVAGHYGAKGMFVLGDEGAKTLAEYVMGK